MPDSMVFYSSFASAIKRLPPDEQLKALWSILDYAWKWTDASDSELSW